MQFQIRPFAAKDVNLFMDSLLGELRRAYPALPDDLFFPAHRELVRRILTDQKARVRILCLAESPDIIAGYSVSLDEEDVVLWLYLKDKYKTQENKNLLLQHLKQPSLGMLCPSLRGLPLRPMSLRRLRKSRTSSLTGPSIAAEPGPASAEPTT